MAEQAGKLGVHLQDLQLGAKRGMIAASRLGAGCIHVPAAEGDISPQNLTLTGRRHVQRFARDLGLRLSALEADLRTQTAGGGLEERIDQTRRIIELASELEVPVVTASLGHVEDDAEHYAVAREALHQVAVHADTVGRFVAIETSAGSQDVILRLLRDLNCSYLKVCYDPGLLLIDGMDPLAPIDPLADAIVLANLRDATRGSSKRPGRETDLGEGHLNIHAYLAQLDQAGYRSDLILRRSASDDPIPHLRAARRYLESVL